jgi:hypothetical protein
MPPSWTSCWFAASPHCHIASYFTVWRLCKPSGLLRLKDRSWRCDRRSVGQAVLESGTRLGPTTTFLLLSDVCWFLMWRPPWREGVSVTYSYNCFWTLPAESLSGPSPAGLMTLICCHIWDSPNWRRRLLYYWRSVSQYVLVSSTVVGLATRYYFLSERCCLKFADLYLWGALSDERTGLQFAV